MIASIGVKSRSWDSAVTYEGRRLTYLGSGATTEAWVYDDDPSVVLTEASVGGDRGKAIVDKARKRAVGAVASHFQRRKVLGGRWEDGRVIEVAESEYLYSLADIRRSIRKEYDYGGIDITQVWGEPMARQYETARVLADGFEHGRRRIGEEGEVAEFASVCRRLWEYPALVEALCLIREEGFADVGRGGKGRVLWDVGHRNVLYRIGGEGCFYDRIKSGKIELVLADPIYVAV